MIRRAVARSFVVGLRAPGRVFARFSSTNNSDMSPFELEEKARTRDAELEHHYHQIKVDTSTKQEKEEVRRRRLIFRSKQRGW